MTLPTARSQPVAGAPTGAAATPGATDPVPAGDAAGLQAAADGDASVTPGAAAVRGPTPPAAAAASDTAGMSPEQLIFACQGMVRSLAWKFAQRLPRSVEMDDLIGYGQVGLTQAARDFDPTRGVRFTTYAYYRIRGAILDGLSKMAWFNVIDFHKGTYERQSEQVLEFDHEDGAAHDPPGDAAWFKRTVSRLAVVSLISDLGERRGGGGQVAAASDGPSAAAADRELLERLHQLVDELPGDAGQLIRGSYFEGRTLTEMAQRLGVSKSWASRLHARTLERLACALRLLGEE